MTVHPEQLGSRSHPGRLPFLFLPLFPRPHPPSPPKFVLSPIRLLLLHRIRIRRVQHLLHHRLLLIEPQSLCGGDEGKRAFLGRRVGIEDGFDDHFGREVMNTRLGKRHILLIPDVVAMMMVIRLEKMNWREVMVMVMVFTRCCGCVPTSSCVLRLQVVLE